jgi:hypothetical protein
MVIVAVATFHIEGNSPIDIELFIILVKGTTRTLAPKTNYS